MTLLNSTMYIVTGTTNTLDRGMEKMGEEMDSEGEKVYSVTGKIPDPPKMLIPVPAHEGRPR